MAIRVYIVEKQKMFREGLKALMLEEKSIQIAGETEDLDHLPSLKSCNVILLDHDSGKSSFLKRVKTLKKTYPSLKIVVVSSEDNSIDVLKAMLEAGVNGYLTKNASGEELTHSIRKVYGDGNYVCTGFVMRLLKHPKRYFKKTKTIELKPAEQTVLDLVAEGLTNKEISEQLGISVRTVETRRKKIMDKTGSVNTAVLIRFATENGLLK
jgi:DNA-binding NarL/FixJ family response regulator